MIDQRSTFVGLFKEALVLLSFSAGNQARRYQVRDLQFRRWTVNMNSVVQNRSLETLRLWESQTSDGELGPCTINNTVGCFEVHQLREGDQTEHGKDEDHDNDVVEVSVHSKPEIQERIGVWVFLWAGLSGKLHACLRLLFRATLPARL